jgi:hypothetical protein
MTTIAAQLSVDSRGPCALYIASDSRITWGSKQRWWDAAQKTFASHASPDIFGYCGSAFFPPQILNQVTRQIDAGLLFDETACADERHGRWLTTIKKSLENSARPDIPAFKLFHGSRGGSGMRCSFRLWQVDYQSGSQSWKDQEVSLETVRSHFASIKGTGRVNLQEQIMATSNEAEAGTSRHAFQQLFASIKEGGDPFSGGAPQIVGLHRVNHAQSFGMIWNNGRYYCGCKLVAGSNFQSIDWFNERFERADGKTMMRLKGAQRH